MPKLPRQTLKARLDTEINECLKELGSKHQIRVEDPSLTYFPVRLKITLLDTPGPMLRNDTIIHRYTHELLIIISDEYPYQRPQVRWLTPIFHPNIMPPEDGGWVCIKILIDWRFSSTLVQLIRGLEYLVSHPNPGHLFGSHTCALASEYFRKHPYVPIPRDGTPIEQPAYIIDDTHKPTVVTVVDAVCPNCSKPVEKDWVGCPYCTAHLPRQDAYDRVKHILSRRGAGRRKPRIITPRDEELRQEVEYIFSTSFCPNCHKVIEKEWKGCPYCTYSFD